MNIFSKKKHLQDQADETAHISLERVGQNHIDTVVAGTRDVPWVLTFLQLAWTAGPVTYIAMQGGHLVGYGEPVTTSSYIFFAIYVIIAAVIALIARIIADSIKGRKQTEAKRELSRALDVLSDAIFTVRDLALSQMDPTRRRREAAAMLLQKTDIGPYSAALAVEEITGDKELAETIKKIEIYRRLGMFSRVNDLIAGSKNRRQDVLQQLEQETTGNLTILKHRLKGQAPNQTYGVKRGDNFINHIFSAANVDDLNLMSLENFEDMIILVLEMLNGREITQLYIDYEGDWELAKALDNVEKTRNHYRSEIASAHHQLRALGQFLNDWDNQSTTPESISDLNADRLLNLCIKGLSRLLNDYKRSKHMDTYASKNLRRQIQIALRHVKQTRLSVEKLHSTYRQHRHAHKTLAKIRRHNAPLIKQLRVQRHKGLRIKESGIVLRNEEKLQVAKQICRYLDDMQIDTGERGVRRKRNPLNIEDAKRLGIQLALILTPAIRLNDPSIQRAIESSRASLFEGLELGFSADAKAGIGAAVVKEVEQDLSHAAELLALRLTRLYKMPLSQSVIDFLSHNYGADPKKLAGFSSSIVEGSTGDFIYTPNEPELLVHYQKWQKPLLNAEKALARYLF